MSLTLPDADHAAIVDALSTLESELSGLDALRKDMSVRFMRKTRATESPVQAA